MPYKDPEKEKRRNHERYLQNKEAMLAKTREWKKNNPEKRRAGNKRYYEAHKAELFAYQRAWQKANPEKVREYQKRNDLKRYHRRSGISWDQYNAAFAEQQGKCLLCKDSNPHTRGGHFRADHCHKTGVFRGLLCNSCNIAIGLLKEDPSLIFAAAEYVRSGGVTLRATG